MMPASTIRPWIMLHVNIITRDTHAQCRVSRSVINAVKHGACLETLFQPSLNRLYQSFLLPSLSIVSSIGRRYTRVDEYAGTVWPAMRTFPSVTISYVILRLRVGARNNCILKCDTYIHTYIQTARCDAELFASRGNKSNHDHTRSPITKVRSRSLCTRKYYCKNCLRKRASYPTYRKYLWLFFLKQMKTHTGSGDKNI